MGTIRALNALSLKAAMRRIAVGVLAGGIVMMAALAAAQEPAPKSEEEGFLSAVGRWFEQQGQNIGSTFKDAGRKFESFGEEAGVAAKTTAEGAKDAAGAVARIPNARVVTGHEKCRNAPNGAPDCLAAALTICKSKGFDTGKSMDMTTSLVCPRKVMMSGRAATSDECHDETFVSRAFCQ